MIQMNLLTMAEYKPVNGHSVDLFIANRQWTPLVGIEFKNATCKIYYQQYDAEDRRSNCCIESDTDENMLKIPFNTPFVHITEPSGDCEKIIGFRILEEHDFAEMKEAAGYWNHLCSMRRYKEREDMSQPDTLGWDECVEEAETLYKPFEDVATVYSEKRWYFKVGSNHQIDQKDYDNEVLGIVDGGYISEQLSPLIKYKGDV